MDPVAALSLACNLTQVVEQAIAVGKTIHQVYKDGSTTANDELQEYVSALREESEKLQESLRQTSPLQVSEAEKMLWTVASDCSKIAWELILKLERLKSHGGKRDALKRAARTLWNKGEIEELLQKLERYQQLLESSTVFAIRDKVNMLASMDKLRFDQIDTHLKMFLDRLNSGIVWLGTEMQGHRRLLEEKMDQNVVQIDHEFRKRLDEQHRLENLAHAKERLLRSLDFAERKSRKNALDEAKRRGTSWPFVDDRRQVSWSSLPKWLADAAPIFWIQGKAGSGKSTLMKYLWRHEETIRILKTRKPHSEPFILAHAFWLSGQSEMEKNFRGMLCSLLYDALETEDELLTLVLSTFPKLKRKIDSKDWDVEDDLVVVLRHVIEIKAATSSVCIFLDGLDEVMEEKHDDSSVMNWIKELSDPGLVKFCVSSRSVTPWIDRLRDVPQLRLQDLNREDIKLYVTNSVESKIHDGNLLSRKENTRAAEKGLFVEHVVQKADGVFLWVVLAMRDILNTKRVTWKHLIDRLDDLPNDLVPLFREMLERRGLNTKSDKKEAATYFKACLDGGLRCFGGIRDPYLHHAVILRAFFHFPTPCRRYDRNYEDFKFDCLDTRDRIEDLCAGLIILEPTGYLRDDDLDLFGPSVDSESEFEMKSDTPQESEDFTEWSQEEEACRLASSEVSDRDEDTDFAQPPNKRFTMQFTEGDDPQGMRAVKLRFYHRTVMDFLRDDPEGKGVLKSCILTDERILEAFVEADLVRHKLRIRKYDVHELTSLLGSINEYHDSHAQTVTTSKVADTIAEVIRTMSRTFEAEAPSDELSDLDSALEQPSTFELFRTDPRLRFSNVHATDVTGLSLELGCTQYFEKYIAPYIAPGGLNQHALTSQYKDYLLLCAVSGNLPETAMQLVDSGADLYVPFYLPLRASQRVSAAGELVKRFSRLGATHVDPWQEVVSKCSPHSCFVLLAGRLRYGQPQLEQTAPGIGYDDVTFVIDAGEVLPVCFREVHADLTASKDSDEKYVGVVVINSGPSERMAHAGRSSEENVQLVVPLTLEFCMRLLGLKDAMISSETEAQRRGSMNDEGSFETLLRPYLGSVHQANLFGQSIISWSHSGSESEDMRSDCDDVSIDGDDSNSLDESTIRKGTVTDNNSNVNVQEDNDDTNTPQSMNSLHAESQKPPSSNEKSSDRSRSSSRSGQASRFLSSRSESIDAFLNHLRNLGLIEKLDNLAIPQRPIRRLEKVQVRSADRSEDASGRSTTSQFPETHSFSLYERTSTVFFDAPESMDPEN